jgi:hypothetical protein
MNTRKTLIFKDLIVAKHLSHLNDKYVVVPADKAPNIIDIVCKSHYIDCLIKELDIVNSLDNPTYSDHCYIQLWPLSAVVIVMSVRVII